MREPYFWASGLDPQSREAAPVTRALLTPFAALYAWATARRLQRTTPMTIPATVICVGNLTAGGVGKSPIVAHLRARLSARGLRTATLSRGYKGRLKGPLCVDPGIHTARDVGDEPLMLADSGESWIGADRAAAGQAMQAAGVDVIIMDDGHQNPSLAKDLSFVVVDSIRGFGNGYVIPKGPLREPIGAGLARADAVILVGDGDEPPEVRASAKTVLRARLKVEQPPAPGRYVGFAGIGHPQRFFDTLAEQPGIDLVDAVPFADHHGFRASDLSYLRRLADQHAASLITTLKDYTRLSPAARQGIAVLRVEMVFDDAGQLDQILDTAISEPKS